MSTQFDSNAPGEIPDKVLPPSVPLLKITLLILSTITLYIDSFIACLESMSTTPATISTSGKALNVRISYGGSDDDSQMTELYKNLTTDHNIRSLSLKVAEHGCMVTTNRFAFSFESSHDMSRRLREISEKDYSSRSSMPRLVRSYSRV